MQADSEVGMEQVTRTTKSKRAGSKGMKSKQSAPTMEEEEEAHRGEVEVDAPKKRASRKKRGGEGKGEEPASGGDEGTEVSNNMSWQTIPK